MDKDPVLEMMSRFKKEIEARNVKVSRMILFGSQATSKARESSDDGMSYGDCVEQLTY